MEARSIVDDALKNVQHFRILCVGRSGVGKSSLINRVFRLEKSPHAAQVSHKTPGDADIDKEFTSPENNYIVLHDSKGFELANANTFNDVDRFIRKRRNSDLPLKDQLHALWLCTETPRAGGHAIEKGDEKLLLLARDTGSASLATKPAILLTYDGLGFMESAPVVIVFTQYDRLVKTKRVELKEEDDSLSEDILRERSKEGARKVLDECIESLEGTLHTMYTRESQMPKPQHVNVSDQPGYEASISSLAQITCDLVGDKLKLMWAIAQRASRQVKINACVDIAMGYPKIPPDPGSSVQPMPLRDCLGRVHQDIITCWNFADEKKTLSSDGFKDLMLYLVQDVQESQNQDGEHVTPPPAIDNILTFVNLITAPSPRTASTMDVFGSASPFIDWLSSAVLDNEPSVQHLFIAYTTDLITVLKLLFDVVEPSSSKGTMQSELTKVFKTYERSGLREQTHRHICETFQYDPPISGTVSFRPKLLELLKHEPLLSDPERTGSQSARVTGVSPASSQDVGETPSPHGGAGTQRSHTETQHAGTGTQHASAETQHAGTGTQHAGSGTQHPGAGTQHPGAGTQHAGAGTQHAGAGTQRTGAGTQRARTGTPRAGAGTQHAGAGTQHATAEIQRAGAGPQHAPAETQHAGAGTQHAGEGTQHAGVGTQHAGAGTQHAGAGTQHAGTGTQRTGAGTQRARTGTPRASAGTQHAGAGTQHASAGIQHAGAGTPHAGEGTQHAGEVTQHAGAGTHHAGAGTQHAGAGTQHAGAGKQYAGAGTQHASAGTQHVGAGTQYAGAGTQHAGAGTHHASAGTQHAGAGTHRTGAGTQRAGAVTSSENRWSRAWQSVCDFCSCSSQPPPQS